VFFEVSDHLIFYYVEQYLPCETPCPTFRATVPDVAFVVVYPPKSVGHLDVAQCEFVVAFFVAAPCGHAFPPFWRVDRLEFRVGREWIPDVPLEPFERVFDDDLVHGIRGLPGRIELPGVVGDQAICSVVMVSVGWLVRVASCN